MVMSDFYFYFDAVRPVAAASAKSLGLDPDDAVQEAALKVWAMYISMGAGTLTLEYAKQAVRNHLINIARRDKSVKADPGADVDAVAVAEPLVVGFTAAEWQDMKAGAPYDVRVYLTLVGHGTRDVTGCLVSEYGWNKEDVKQTRADAAEWLLAAVEGRKL